MKRRIIILGAGLSGLSTAYFLKKKGLTPQIFEREAKPGGLCVSDQRDGFTFDKSGHLLHFRTPKLLSLVKNLLGGNLVKHKRSAWVYAFDRFIPYPFQANFCHLPPKVAGECFLKFIEARHNYRSFKNNNFLDWIYHKFGSGISRHFLLPYNLKFWKCSLKRLEYEWAERFIVVPSLRDIIDSFNHPPRLGYSACFYYPKKGGIEELAKALAYKVKEVYLSHEAAEINLREKFVKFKNGSKERFDTLISTIPLPEVAKIIKGLPGEVLSNFRKLNWLSIYNVNLGIQGKSGLDRHWIYFPQKGVSFFRTGFFHNFSSFLTPQGNSSLYIDVSYAQNRPFDKKGIVSRIKKDLRKLGIISGRVITQRINNIKYAYPIYDKNYKLVRENILNFLSKNNIVSCGRFGSWRYLSMEDVIGESEKITKFQVTMTN